MVRVQFSNILPFFRSIQIFYTNILYFLEDPILFVKLLPLSEDGIFRVVSRCNSVKLSIIPLNLPVIRT